MTGTFFSNGGVTQDQFSITKSGSTPPPPSPYHYEPFIALSGSNFLDTAITPQLQLPKFSVGSWFKTSNAYTSDAFIANKGGSGSETAGKNMNYGIWMNSAEKIQAGFETRTGADNEVTSPLTYNDGQWHYAVVTYDAAPASPAVRLYIDGALVGTKATTAAPDNTGTQPVRIGANSRTPNGFFTGNADEVRVWNRELTSQEVQNGYNNGQFADPQAILYVDSEITPPPPPPYHYDPSITLSGSNFVDTASTPQLQLPNV